MSEQETTNQPSPTNDEVVYFELNNWFCGEDYPADEPFITWMDMWIDAFCNKMWVEHNKLCVVMFPVDMSVNFLITAPKKWVEVRCPKLLTEHKRFLRYPDPDEEGIVYSRLYTDIPFLEYKPENFGIKRIMPECEVYEEEEDEEID